jgi:aspartate kinase
MEQGIIPVVTGFIAANQDGIVTTVGRGGSDYTATILGVALQADEVWIWTDVDGIMTTDPKLVSAARMLPQFSYQEAAEMAIFGAKAMHPRALGPVKKKTYPYASETPATHKTWAHSLPKNQPLMKPNQ